MLALLLNVQLGGVQGDAAALAHLGDERLEPLLGARLLRLGLPDACGQVVGAPLRLLDAVLEACDDGLLDKQGQSCLKGLQMLDLVARQAILLAAGDKRLQAVHLLALVDDAPIRLLQLVELLDGVAREVERAWRL